MTRNRIMVCLLALLLAAPAPVFAGTCCVADEAPLSQQQWVAACCCPVDHCTMSRQDIRLDLETATLPVVSTLSQLVTRDAMASHAVANASDWLARAPEPQAEHAPPGRFASASISQPLRL